MDSTRSQNITVSWRRSTDVRIIAGTNRELEELTAAGTFRGDLFYRLNVYPVYLPPLRERKEGLVPLALHFLQKFSRELRKEVTTLSTEASKLLMGYHWPGNVRELENVMEQAVILCRGTVVTAQELALSLRERPKGQPPVGEAFGLPPGGIALTELERRLIVQALEKANYNKSKAGKLLGLSRTQLRTRMKNHGLETGQASPPAGTQRSALHGLSCCGSIGFSNPQTAC